MDLSTNITQAWDDLFMESRRVDASLVSVKKKFTEVSIRRAVKYSFGWLIQADSELSFCLPLQAEVKYSFINI